MRKSIIIGIAFLLILSVALLCACGQKISLTINFDSNGGSEISPINTDGQSVIKIPSDPVKEGYEFGGWFWDNGTFEKQFTFNSLLDAPISENMTVYAKWISKNPDTALFSISAANIVYGQQPAVTVTENTTNGTITYYYKPYGADDSAYTQTIPANAGKYTVKAVSISASATHNATCEFTIEKANGYINTDSVLRQFTYNKNAQSISGAAGSGTIIYTNNSFTDAGSYEIIINAAESENYKAVSVSVTVNVAKASFDMSNVKWSDNEFVYDKTIKRIELIDLPEGLTASYENGEKTDAGFYQAAPIFSYDTKNYNAPAGISPLNWTISPKNITVIADNKISVYGQAEASLTYTVADGGLIENDTLSGSMAKTSGQNAGVYQINIGSLSNPNYNINFVEATYTIEKAVYDMSNVYWDYAEPFRYNETTHEVELKGLPQGVTVKLYHNNTGSMPGGIQSASVSEFNYDTVNYVAPLLPQGKISVDWQIIKGIPVVNPYYCGNILSILSDLPILTLDADDTEGTIQLNEGTVLEEGEKSYNWTFTPANSDLYENLNGAITLIVYGQAPTGITLDSLPSKLSYNAFETLDVTGMTVILTFENPEFNTVITNYDIVYNGDRNCFAAWHTFVTIRYGQFNIVIENIEVQKLPYVFDDSMIPEWFDITYGGLPLIDNEQGCINWNEQEIYCGLHSYTFTFSPNDDNYNEYTGEITLYGYLQAYDVITLSIKGDIALPPSNGGINVQSDSLIEKVIDAKIKLDLPENFRGNYYYTAEIDLLIDENGYYVNSPNEEYKIIFKGYKYDNLIEDEYINSILVQVNYIYLKSDYYIIYDIRVNNENISYDYDEDIEFFETRSKSLAITQKANLARFELLDIATLETIDLKSVPLISGFNYFYLATYIDDLKGDKIKYIEEIVIKYISSPVTSFVVDGLNYEITDEKTFITLYKNEMNFTVSAIYDEDYTLIDYSDYWFFIRSGETVTYDVLPGDCTPLCFTSGYYNYIVYIRVHRPTLLRSVKAYIDDYDYDIDYYDDDDDSYYYFYVGPSMAPDCFSAEVPQDYTCEFRINGEIYDASKLLIGKNDIDIVVYQGETEVERKKLECLYLPILNISVYNLNEGDFENHFNYIDNSSIFSSMIFTSNSEGPYTARFVAENNIIVSINGTIYNSTTAIVENLNIYENYLDAVIKINGIDTPITLMITVCSENYDTVLNNIYSIYVEDLDSHDRTYYDIRSLNSFIYMQLNSKYTIEEWAENIKYNSANGYNMTFSVENDKHFKAKVYQNSTEIGWFLITYIIDGTYNNIADANISIFRPEMLIEEQVDSIVFDENNTATVNLNSDQNLFINTIYPYAMINVKYNNEKHEMYEYIEDGKKLFYISRPGIYEIEIISTDNTVTKTFTLNVNFSVEEVFTITVGDKTFKAFIDFSSPIPIRGDFYLDNDGLNAYLGVSSNVQIGDTVYVNFNSSCKASKTYTGARFENQNVLDLKVYENTNGIKEMFFYVLIYGNDLRINLLYEDEPIDVYFSFDNGQDDNLSFIFKYNPGGSYGNFMPSLDCRYYYVCIADSAIMSNIYTIQEKEFIDLQLFINPSTDYNVEFLGGAQVYDKTNAGSSNPFTTAKMEVFEHNGIKYGRAEIWEDGESYCSLVFLFNSYYTEVPYSEESR